MTKKAGVIAHPGLALIAVSFRRLFLGGLLLSRARFRFLQQLKFIKTN